MRYQRVVLPLVLLIASACVRTPPATSLAPQLGPTGSIRALYDGGFLQRRVSAHFTVDQGSYAMVAHLGGDGVIRIVYPHRAANAWVRPGQMYRTSAFSGDYDAAPGYYFMAVTHNRSPGARNWSYDGRGHAFVFLILTRRPFRLNQMSDFGLWDEFEVRRYQTMDDPRVAIRKFADAVTGGTDYTIEYAHSFTTYAYSTYADRMWDCSMLYSGFGGWSYLDGWLYGNRYASRCGNYFGYAYGYPYGYGDPWSWQRPVATVPVNPTPTPTPVAQRQPRPTFVPTIPSDRRTPERRGTTATAYTPTWADNPSFAPEPRERRGTASGRNSYPGRTGSTADRRGDDSRRGSSSGESGASGTSSTGNTSQPAPAASPAPAPAPTMSPGHAGGSGSGRRPPG